MLELVLVYFLVLFDLLLVGLIWCVLLGLIVGVCSGDKGGLVNVGVWVCIDEQWCWLVYMLIVELFKELLLEMVGLVVICYVLLNLWVLNFVIEVIFGQGVVYQVCFDLQVKGLGEWLCSCYVEILEILL